jgi:hypothetical protein
VGAGEDPETVRPDGERLVAGGDPFDGGLDRRQVGVPVQPVQRDVRGGLT